MTMMILPLRHRTLNLPNDIHGACADLWVFTTNGDAGRKRAVDTENHSLSLRRQNGHVTVYPGMITSERKKARLKKHLRLAPTFNRLMPLKDLFFFCFLFFVFLFFCFCFFFFFSCRRL